MRPPACGRPSAAPLPVRGQYFDECVFAAPGFDYTKVFTQAAQAGSDPRRAGCVKALARANDNCRSEATARAAVRSLAQGFAFS